jgi:electron transfer flavoprotein beta subunit
MDIVVCIKQVPATTEVRIDQKTHSLIRESAEAIINPFDENAVEAGLQLRDQYGGKVTVMTMGPPQAEGALRQAIAMGADDAVLITDSAFRLSDTLATSYTLSLGIRKLGNFDLVICGKQAIDGDTAQVGPGVAERLGLPQATFVIGLEIEGRKIKAKRMLEDSFEVVEMRMPALITVVKQINEPRLAPMKGVLRSRKVQITIWDKEALGADPDRIGLEGSPTTVMKSFRPERRRAGEMLQGGVEEMVEALAKKVIDLKVIQP